MLKNVYIVISLAIISLAVADTCKTYSCASLVDDYCWKLREGKVFIKPCKDNTFCKINDFKDSDENKSCQQSQPRNIRLYLGSPCTVNEDCFSDNCDGEPKVCIDPNEVGCFDHEDCKLGTACYKKEGEVNKTCQPYKKEGDMCDESYECPRTHGCFGKDKKVCTPYFSLDNGVDAEDDDSGPSFCKSGYLYQGKCRVLTRKTKTCTTTDVCKYTLDDNTDVEINENCSCGFNKSAEKYCKHGTDSASFSNFIVNTKKMLNLEKCHTLERSGFCNYYLLNPDENKTIANFTNSLIKFEYSNMIEDADACVLKTVFTEYDASLDTPIPDPTIPDPDKKPDPDPPKPDPPQPDPPKPDPPVDQPKCALYVCDKTPDGSCASSHFDEKKNYNTVVLNNICPKGKICRTPNRRPFEEFTKTKKDLNGVCEDSNIKPGTIYPGEPCTKDSDCYSLDPVMKNGKCDKVCSGAKEDEECQEHHHCLAGNFCDSGKCKAQKKVDQECTNTNECKNNLVCYNGKCSDKYFSLDAGEKTDDAMLCKTERVNKDGVCISLFSTDTKDYKNRNLVKCEYGEKCNYKDNNEKTYKLDCECGYNLTGDGYCPRDDKDRSDDMSAYHEVLKKSYDNDCHTLNRYSCLSAPKLDKVKTAYRKAHLFHLFNNAAKCAEDVLSSGLVKISVLVLAILTFIF
jgi:hypothetical protein